MSDVLRNKAQSIQLCVQRAREEYHLAEEDFRSNFSRQDAAVLNILRGCELAIDLANHIVKIHQLGVPTNSRDSFARLSEAGLISATQAKTLSAMIGFRNIAVHAYRQMDIEIVIKVIESELDQLLAFVDTIKALE